MKRTITVERLPENSGPSVNIPKFGQVTTYPLTEGVDMAQAQQITDTVMTITPAEFGAQVIFSDLMAMTVRDRFAMVAGRILGESFDRQQDQTLVDDFDSYARQVGGAGHVMAIGHITAMEAAIKNAAQATGTAGRGGEPGPGQVHVVHTPNGFHGVKKSLGGPVESSGAAADPVVSNNRSIGFEEDFRIGTVMCHTDINLSKDASDDAKGGAYVPGAQILVILGNEIDNENERDASLRATEMNLVGRWARGEYKDLWGREALFASQDPSS